jgi:esterase
MPEILNHKILGEGQPLVILHGLFGSLDNWITLGKRFSENFQVVLVDQRNHGKSFHDSTFSYEAMSEDLEILMVHLGLEKTILLGHSLGGKTVMQFCAFNPDKVDKLIVADIGPKQYPVHHDLIIQGLKSVPLDSINKREEVDMHLAENIPDIGIRTFLMKNLKRNNEGKFEWKMNLDSISRNIEEVGKPLDFYLPIEVPTLFVRGGNSNYILDDDLSEIEKIFPDASLETVNNSGHWLHAEQPEEFYQKVMRFI